MALPDHFRLSPESRLLTPPAAGPAALLALLRDGAPIRVGQSGGVTAGTRPGFLCCETSGSGGSPKTVRRRPATWIASFEINAGLFGVTGADRYGVLGPLGPSLSLYAMLEALHLGAGLALLHGRSPRAQAEAAAGLGITLLYATPAQLRLLVTGARAAGLPALPSVRLILAGGGKLEPGLRSDLARLCPEAECHEFYGSSETSFITLGDAATPAGSVGRAYPGVQIRIGATGNQPGETGAIWVASPYLFDGYEAGDTAGCQRDGAFLTVGDIGYLDAAGHLFLRGRRDRMVTVADSNVFPEEIERTVAALPGIAACAALALPDPARGHRIACICVAGGADPGAPAALAPLIRQTCRAELGPAAVPREIRFRDDIPRLDSGKPDLAALRLWLEAGG